MAVKLYIGGLSYSTTSEALREHFAQCGTVESATVITDRYSGQSRGFGFVEMANADVTDATLEYLHGMNQLEYLDLSGSQITDQGLQVLAELPRLEKLFVDRTGITDKGLEEFLIPQESLRLLSAEHTGVTAAGAKAFTASQKGRKIKF